MVFQWGACIRVPHDCCCCHGCCVSFATVDACRHSFTLCPVMLRPPTLSIQIYACVHKKEVLTFKSSTRISWSRQLLLEIDTYIHRNESCTTAASLRMDFSVHVWKYWLSRSPNGRRALRVTVSRCTRKPARLSDGRFNSASQPSCFIFMTTNHVAMLRSCRTQTRLKCDQDAFHVQQKWLHIHPKPETCCPLPIS